MKLRKNFLRKGYCVESFPVGSVVIVAPPSDRMETRAAIHFNGRVAVADFKMDPSHAGGTGALDEVVEKQVADPLTMSTRQDSQEEQFGLVRYAARQRKADDAAGIGIPRNDQRDADHRQDPSALR